jgi:type I restriction enzyme M protein
MLRSQLNNIESSLWNIADQLRANSKLTASEYSMPVLGLIFLRHAYNRFLLIEQQINKDRPSHPQRGLLPVSKSDYIAKKALYLPEESRFDYLEKLPEGTTLGEKISHAMKLIEDENENLKGVLPIDYEKFSDDLLRELIRELSGDKIKNAEGDVFGRIYEYFLNNFAMTGAQEGGEFFTPLSLVQTIVNVIEPNHGIIFDPACGSAGMFVQSGHFIEESGLEPEKSVTFFGQEKTETNTRLAKMNMAVHGLEGKIVEGNSFYDYNNELVGNCDFVMANPPFNVDSVDKKKIVNDSRLPFGIPKNDNANYLWIQYFYSYLNENGRAGFVMASSASDAGHSEKEIRKQIVETGAVDVMIAIGTNFFYTRTLPCTLWFFDRNKEKDEALKDRTLMLDVRNIYRVVTRKINDFSPEQSSNIKAIVGLYRGDSVTFLTTVKSYFDSLRQFLTEVGDNSSKFIVVFSSFYDKLKPHCEENNLFAKEFEVVQKVSLQTEVTAFSDSLKEINSENLDFNFDNISLNIHLHDEFVRFSTLVSNALNMRHNINENVKNLLQLSDSIQKEIKLNNATKGFIQGDWKASEIKKKINEIELSKNNLFESIKQAKYFHYEIKWLQSRFPDAVYNDVSGLCKVVTIEEIEANDYSLTPGKYVGVSPKDEDNFDFTEKLKAIHLELSALNDEASKLAETISQKFQDTIL